MMGVRIVNGDKEEGLVDRKMFKVNVGDREY